MNQNVGKDAKSPNENEMNFLYILGYQDTNDSLINFISTRFNSIPEHSSRKLKIFDWIYSINWMLERVTHYDSLELIWFCQKYFNNDATWFNYDNLNKALYFLENLENFGDIQMVGDKKFDSIEIPEKKSKIEVEAEISESNKTILSGYNLYEQQEMVNVYKWYKEELNEQMCEFSYPADYFELTSDVINSMIRSKMAEELKIVENFEIVDKICYNLFDSNSIIPQNVISEDERVQLINNHIGVNENLNTISYYIHYVLISLGVIPKEKTSIGIGIFSREQSRIVERLLCAITTKEWAKFEQKGNNYYQAIYRMFKFTNEGDDWERNRMLKQLSLVKTMLIEGKFKHAIDFLDKDVEKIKAYTKSS